MQHNNIYVIDSMQHTLLQGVAPPLLTPLVVVFSLLELASSLMQELSMLCKGELAGRHYVAETAVAVEEVRSSRRSTPCSIQVIQFKKYVGRSLVEPGERP